MTWHLDESGRYGESGANNIKWSHYGKWYMEQYDTDPKLDMTADCSENSPQGDKLDVAYISTSIPNWWVQIKNDCGQSSVREEVDLHIWTGSLWAETPYYYRVWYRIQSGGYGEVNLTYQRESPPPRWDWLDKVTYWAPYAKGSAGADGENCSTTSCQESKSEVPLPRWNHGDLYSYAVEQAADGTVDVTVWINFDDMDVHARYVEANKALAERLIAGKKGRVPVTVTFLRPLPLSETKAIIEASGMQVTAVGLDAVDKQGAKTTIVGIPRSGQFLDEPELSQVVLQPGGYTLKGAVVLSGEMEATEEGLGRLLNHEGIYLVDVTAAEVRELVAAQLSKAGSDISVFTPSPHWLIGVESE
jgi:hypothetical protein